MLIRYTQVMIRLSRILMTICIPLEKKRDRDEHRGNAYLTLPYMPNFTCYFTQGQLVIYIKKRVVGGGGLVASGGEGIPAQSPEIESRNELAKDHSHAAITLSSTRTAT